jgi:hypothetical protein
VSATIKLKVEIEDFDLCQGDTVASQFRGKEAVVIFAYITGRHYLGKSDRFVERNLGMEDTEWLYIGTSGCHYDHWQGSFYPQDLPNKEWLGRYSQRLSSVMINNSFYHLPCVETFQEMKCT